MGCAAAPTPQDLGLLRHTACTGLLPLRARSRASLAPTAFGQNQKRATSQICFCRRRRSSPRLRGQRWAAQRPQHLRTLVCSDTSRAPVYCRCAPDRGQATLLPPSARIKSFAGKPRFYGLRPESKASRASLAPTAFGQNQRLCGQASQTACGQNQKRATS